MSPPSLVRGRIVWATVSDQKGVNPKRRPVVLLLGVPDTGEGEPLLGVGVTTTFSLPLPDDHVELPHSMNPASRPLTGLRERSAAVCSWLVQVERDAIEQGDVIGLVPPDLMEQILECVRRIHRPPPAQGR
jgi:hypothetical protein